MKRNYPLFMIDRRKDGAYPFEYITCLDSEVGFVARVVVFRQEEAYTMYIEKAIEVTDFELSTYGQQHGSGGVILVIENFLYEIEVTNDVKRRVQTLLKKALKKYIHSSIEKDTNGKDLGINNQIKMMQATVERAKANYTEIVKVTGEIEAKYNIKLAEAILATLEKIKSDGQN